MTTSLSFANPAATAAAEAAIDRLSDLSGRVLQAAERLAALNVQTVKTVLAEAEAHVQAAWAVRGIDELQALQASALRSVPGKAAAYGGHVREILGALVGGSAELVQESATAAGDAVAEAGAAVRADVKEALAA